MQKKLNKQFPLLVIFLFTFAIYGVTLFNDYALDDLMVIKQNAFTLKGVSGIREIFAYDSFTGFWGKEKKLVAGGRYRPFSIATFALEKSIVGGLNPMLSHLINILLYALTGCMIFLIFSKFGKAPPGQKWYLGFPFLAAMLFIAHPVHTEVVANIKGRDEIFALLFPLVTLWLTILYIEKPRIILIILSNLSFFLGLLSKENAIMFVAIVPLAVYFFFRVPLKKTLLITFPLAITALAFVFVRFLVLGQVFSSGIPRELLNNPFLDATADQRFGTIMYTLGLYIKLLFFPHPLTHDYYPYQIPLVSLTDIRSLIPVIMYSAMIFYLLRRFSKKEIVVFGLAFYLLTLLIVSNLLFAVGTFMNERFIYMPSLGFVIIMIYLVAVKLPSRFKSKAASKIVVLAIMFPVLLLFSIKTYTRNQVWKDDFTLFSTDVLVSGNSIKCNISAGGDYINKAVNEPDTVKKMEYFGHSMQYLEKALRLAPSSINALVLYGNLNALYLKDYKKAIEQYFKVLYIDQSNEPAMTNAIKILESVDNQKDCAYKLKSYQFLLKINPANSDICYNIGRLYGRYAGNLDSAGIYLEKAIKLSPGDIKAYKDLGIICSMKKDFARAIELFKTAAALDPKDIQVKQNLEVTYRIMQREKK